MVILAAAITFQLLDLATYSPATEQNGLVLFLGGWAIAAKLLLIAYLGVLAYVLPRLYARRVLLVASGFGLLGLASNVA